MSKPATRRRLISLAVQALGLAAGVASLWWCISMALRQENRQQLAHLGDAPRSLIAALAVLSLGTLLTNGLMFWVALLPVRRLRAADVVATNALSTMLAYLPLKAGAVVRIAVHNRRDHVPLATIGAWFTALLVEMALAFAPAIAATIWLQRIDGAWALVVAAMVAAGIAVTVSLARAFRGAAGHARIARLAGPIAPLRRFLATRLWTQLHAGFDMLSAPSAVAAGALLRLADLSIHAGRFLVAAKILGVALSPAQALPIALTYFIIGVVSPSGLAGLREGGATVLFGSLFAAAGMASKEAREHFAAVALLVTAVEAVSFLIGGALGLAWLRPDRLIRRGAARGPRAAVTPPPSVPPSTPSSGSPPSDPSSPASPSTSRAARP